MKRYTHSLLCLLLIMINGNAFAADGIPDETMSCAKAGYAVCQIELGKAYAFGNVEWGTTKDYDAALNWLELAVINRSYGPNTEAIILLEDIKIALKDDVSVEEVIARRDDEHKQNQGVLSDKSNLNLSERLRLAESREWRVQNYSKSYDDLIWHYPESLTLNELTQEQIGQLKSDPILRLKMAGLVEDVRQLDAQMTAKYCLGSWMKIPTTCFSYHLSKAGFPKWLGITIVYGLLLIALLTIVYVTLFCIRKLVINKQGLHVFLSKKATKYVISTYVVWAAMVIITNNFQFTNGIRCWEYDNDEGALYLIFLPLTCLLGVGLLKWARAGKA